MSVNREIPHLLILPEDDANRQLVNGFLKNPSLNLRAVAALPHSGGWSKVCSDFVTTYVPILRKYPLGHIVLLVDFDNQVENRLRYFRERFPEDLAERVYLLGTLDEPEPLRVSRGISLEKIGAEISDACLDDNWEHWNHEFLRHNEGEVLRLIENVKSFIFRPQ